MSEPTKTAVRFRTPPFLLPENIMDYTTHTLEGEIDDTHSYEAIVSASWYPEECGIGAYEYGERIECQELWVNKLDDYYIETLSIYDSVKDIYVLESVTNPVACGTWYNLVNELIEPDVYDLDPPEVEA